MDQPPGAPVAQNDTPAASGLVAGDPTTVMVPPMIDGSSATDATISRVLRERPARANIYPVGSSIPPRKAKIKTLSMV